LKLLANWHSTDQLAGVLLLLKILELRPFLSLAPGRQSDNEQMASAALVQRDQGDNGLSWPLR